MKSITTSTQQFIEGNRLHTAHLLYFRLVKSDDRSVAEYYLTDFVHDIETTNATYTAMGHLMGISNLDQSNDLQVQKATFTISGIDGNYISAIFNYDYIDREVEVSRIFMDEIGTQYPEHKIFAGRLNQPAIKHSPDGESFVQLSASSYLSDFDRKPNRHTNHIEHTKKFPNDNFFKPFGKVERDIIWGKE